MLHLLRIVTIAVALVPSNGLVQLSARVKTASMRQHLTLMELNNWRRARDCSMAFPRVVVTGMGVVSCLGTTIDEVKDSLFETKSGLSYCQEFADVGMKSQVSGMPDKFDWCVPLPNPESPRIFLPCAQSQSQLPSNVPRAHRWSCA